MPSVTHDNSSALPSGKSPLTDESRLAGVCAADAHSGVSEALFRDCLRSFRNCERQIGRVLSPSAFRSPALANSDHGIGHTTRVMFWIALLARLHDVDERTTLLALTAAYLHDLARTDENADSLHGEAAATSETTRLMLSSLGLSAEESAAVRHAIRQHCLEDGERDDPIDVLSQLLRDADALDRGRFGRPGEPEGCELRRLGLPVFAAQPGWAHALASVAFHIAALTRYEDWSGNTFAQLVDRIESGLNDCV